MARFRGIRKRQSAGCRLSAQQSNARRLQFERLEVRLVLAQATGVAHTFREDDFSITGTFTYQQHLPADHDYIDTINNGQYSSSSGHVKWTSATDGTGFFVGTATGDGRDTVEFGGRRNCSEYGIEDKGRMDFTLDAQKGSLRMDNVDSTSTRYTYYRDLTGGRCPAANPPYSRFFGGLTQHYVGTYAPATHQVAVRYSEVNPSINVNAPGVELKWSTTAPTDISLIAVPTRSTPVVPAGFVGIAQTTQPPPVPGFVDVQNGGIDLTVNLSGKPVKTPTPQTPVATIRAFWASSETDTSGAEIPLTSTQTPLGLFWNSTKLQAKIGQFPTPPATARFIRIATNAAASADGDPANSTRYLRIGEFQARSSTGAAMQEDVAYNGSSDSVLHALDRADASIKVFAYQPQSALGAQVVVDSDAGGFTYNPTAVTAVQDLGVGDSIQDTIRFVAVKSQTLLSEATLTVTVQGSNDAPIAVDDSSATTNFQTASILPSVLLSNDLDPDRTDGVVLRSVSTTSQLGGSIEVVKNDSQTEIVEIRYDPSKSTTLRGLAVGQKALDRFTYEIVDRNGAVDSADVVVEVTGEERFLSIAAVASQYTTAGVQTGSIPLAIDDPDGGLDDVQVEATSDHSSLVPSSGIEIVKQGTDFSLRVSPAANLTGRTQITLSARNDRGQTATTKFRLIVGSQTDLDLDGIANSIEDAAPGSGDMNQDGTPDSRQAHVASVQPNGNTHFVNLALVEPQQLVDVSLSDSPTASGLAEGAQFPLGLMRFQVLTETAGTLGNLTIQTSDGSSELNRLFEYDAEATSGQGWSLLMHNKRDGARIFADRIVVNLRDGARGDVAKLTDGSIFAAIALGHVPRPWQNFVREDIDNDGVVAPLDALQVINQLNNFGPRGLGMRPTGTQSLPGFLDPSGNNSLEPIDALIVINFLNDRALNPEGEAGDFGLFVAPSLAGRFPGERSQSLQDDDTESGVRFSHAAQMLAIVPLEEGNDAESPAGNSAVELRRRHQFAADVDELMAATDGEFTCPWAS